jgi:hypothetical protein
MNEPRMTGARRHLTMALLTLLSAALLSSCGADMHATDGVASAAVTLQATGVPKSVVSALGAPTAVAASPAGMQLGNGISLTLLRLGIERLGLRPVDESEAMAELDMNHVADLMADGHRMGSILVPGGRSYQLDVEMGPVPGTEPQDPGAARSMVLELAYVEPATGYAHTFRLRSDAPVALHMTGPSGLMMGGGAHELILAWELEGLPLARYAQGSILDALLATPMDAGGVHALDAADYPDLFAAILEAMHQSMVFGEDMNHDGHLHDGDDHMIGHHGDGSMM